MNFKRIVTNSLITSLSVLIGIIFCEFIGRKIGLGDPVIYVKDDISGYRLKPNQNKIRRRLAEISTDSEGFRVDNTKKRNKENKYIVFVGDSVTYGGSYIDNINIFSSKYCQYFFDDHFCLNNGVNGWGVINMGRFISNFNIYSKRKPEKFILVILPGDEKRNFQTIKGLPFWSTKPRFPSAINEVGNFVISNYLLPNLKNKKEPSKLDTNYQENINSLQREIIWKELEHLIKDSDFDIDIVITPPIKWFKKEKESKDWLVYDNLLSNISKLEIVKNTCNLYYYVLPEFNNNLYVDGVHLSKNGHDLWAKKLKKCLHPK